MRDFDIATCTAHLCSRSQLDRRGLGGCQGGGGGWEGPPGEHPRHGLARGGSWSRGSAGQALVIKEARALEDSLKPPYSSAPHAAGSGGGCMHTGLCLEDRSLAWPPVFGWHTGGACTHTGRGLAGPQRGCSLAVWRAPRSCRVMEGEAPGLGLRLVTGQMLRE